MLDIPHFESAIERRSMQMYSLVSPFPWPIQAEPSRRKTNEGWDDPVLVEWDMYHRDPR